MLKSRETAKSLGKKAAPASLPSDASIGGSKQGANGSVRASSWNNIPIIRMSNINLEPMEGSLNDLIADTKDGIFLQTNKSWSIDTLRLNF